MEGYRHAPAFPRILANPFPPQPYSLIPQTQPAISTTFALNNNNTFQPYFSDARAGGIAWPKLASQVPQAMTYPQLHPQFIPAGFPILTTNNGAMANPFLGQPVQSTGSRPQLHVPAPTHMSSSFATRPPSLPSQELSTLVSDNCIKTPPLPRAQIGSVATFDPKVSSERTTSFSRTAPMVLASVAVEEKPSRYINIEANEENNTKRTTCTTIRMPTVSSKGDTAHDEFRNRPISKKSRLGDTHTPVKEEPEVTDGKTDREGDSATSQLLATLQGDRRLVINFESFGTKGKYPQKFGKSGLLIPDGLIGTHTVYQERWRFEIHHTAQVLPGSDIACITWTITNAKTGVTHSRTETPEEAESRVALGWTISSKLFREAMSYRAQQLETSLAGETNQCRVANIHSLIKTLQPKTFTQGPLIFGLKHRAVQEKIGNY